MKDKKRETDEFVAEHVQKNNVRFTNAHAQQDQVAKDFKDKMKAEKKRHADKVAARDEILHKKNIEHLKMMEENKLRTQDAQENLEFLRQRKQQN